MKLAVRSVSFSLVGAVCCVLVGAPFLRPGELNSVYVGGNQAALVGGVSRCAVSQLSFRSSGRYPGDTEDVGALILVTNVRGTVCALEGRPAAMAKLSNGQAVAAQPDGLASSLPATVGRVILRHDRVAFVRFRDPSECAAGANHSSPSYVAVSLHVDDHNVTVRLRGQVVPDSCRSPLYESPYYQ